MDLDEVGSKTKTPRKHNRFTVKQVRSPPFNLEGRNDPMQDRYDEDDDVVHEEDHRKAEKGFADLWQEEQAGHAHRQEEQMSKRPIVGQGMTANQTPKLRAGSNEDMAEKVFESGDRQVDDFNQRMREALYRSKDISSKLKTPKLFDYSPPISRGNHGTNTIDFGLPTPTTAVRPKSLLSTRLGDSVKRRQVNTPSVLCPTDANNQILPRTSDHL